MITVSARKVICMNSFRVSTPISSKSVRSSLTTPTSAQALSVFLHNPSGVAPSCET